MRTCGCWYWELGERVGLKSWKRDFEIGMYFTSRLEYMLRRWFLEAQGAEVMDLCWTQGSPSQQNSGFFLVGKAFRSEVIFS